MKTLTLFLALLLCSLPLMGNGWHWQRTKGGLDSIPMWDTVVVGQVRYYPVIIRDTTRIHDTVHVVIYKIDSVKVPTDIRNAEAVIMAPDPYDTSAWRLEFWNWQDSIGADWIGHCRLARRVGPDHFFFLFDSVDRSPASIMGASYKALQHWIDSCEAVHTPKSLP